MSLKGCDLRFGWLCSGLASHTSSILKPTYSSVHLWSWTFPVSKLCDFPSRTSSRALFPPRQSPSSPTWLGVKTQTPVLVSGVKIGRQRQEASSISTLFLKAAVMSVCRCRGGSMFDDLFQASPGQVDWTCNSSQIFGPKISQISICRKLPFDFWNGRFCFGRMYMRVRYPLISILIFFFYFFEQFKVPSATSAIITNGEYWQRGCHFFFFLNVSGCILFFFLPVAWGMSRVVFFLFTVKQIQVKSWCWKQMKLVVSDKHRLCRVRPCCSILTCLLPACLPHYE